MFIALNHLLSLHLDFLEIQTINVVENLIGEWVICA